MLRKLEIELNLTDDDERLLAEVGQDYFLKWMTIHGHLVKRVTRFRIVTQREEGINDEQRDHNANRRDGRG